MFEALGQDYARTNSQDITLISKKIEVFASHRAAEGFTCPWPPMLKQDPAVVTRIDAIWKKLGIE
jgi:hypothetical protein